MYGSASNHGAGRGGGGSRVGSNTGPHNKRSSFPPPPRPNRPVFRPSLGVSNVCNPRGGANHTFPVLANGTTPSSSVDENYSLISGVNSNAFAIMVKMAPGLVDELNKIEAMGEIPRIKFDSSGANPTGNVIEVGGKEFKFTWSPEVAQLCDIYEEQQGGEDGGSLLVRSGSCLRKVNVQRILDESTTNHVKMRSEEAERQLKSRKAIVLDHSNPSMKNQLKQIAAVETNQWKGFKQKNDSPFKKQKTEAPIKSTFASAIVSTVARRGRSSSPVITSSGSKIKDQSRIDVPSQIKKDNLISPHKENILKSTISSKDTSPFFHKGRATQTDFQNALITLLKDNPDGISYKALERGLIDDFPNFVPSMEAALKEVASFQSPERYFLKPGFENGSSPEDNNKMIHQANREGSSTRNDKLDEGNSYRNSLGEEQPPLEPTEFENLPNSPDIDTNNRASETHEAVSGSSNDSGSDSETDSASESESHNQSKSPMGSGSASSGGDTDSDASCNSKEGSDVDVDIMKSDDENESHPVNLAPLRVDQSPVTGNVTFEADNALIDNMKEMIIANDTEKSFDDREILMGHLFGTNETQEADPNSKTITKLSLEDSRSQRQKPKKVFESDNAGKRRQFNESPYREYSQRSDTKSTEKNAQTRRGLEKKMVQDAKGENQNVATKSLQRDLSDLEQGELRETDDNPMDLGLQNVEKPSPSPVSMKNSAERQEANPPISKQESSRHFPNGKPKQNESAFKQGRKEQNLPLRFSNASKSNGKNESSAEEDSSSFYKYEKETPHLKGPIKEFSQYKDYVQEYREKYECYCEINKILVGYRDEFQKLGKELESTEGKDLERYNRLCSQLKESYNRCGPRHKRLKKVFIVLHEELKSLKARIKDYAAS